jgi:hypothetical protein
MFPQMDFVKTLVLFVRPYVSINWFDNLGTNLVYTLVVQIEFWLPVFLATVKIYEIRLYAASVGH